MQMKISLGIFLQGSKVIKMAELTKLDIQLLSSETIEEYERGMAVHEKFLPIFRVYSQTI